MAEWLYALDLALFRFGNATVANPVGDMVFPFITEVRYFYIPYALLLLGVAIIGKKRGLLAVGLLVLVITASDQLSSSVIKEWVGRIRPCHVLDDVRLLVGCGSGKSFPSSHAVNNFAAAMLFWRFYPKVWPWAFIWAALVAYSRVYVGVHYPADVLAGAVLGSALAWLIVEVSRRLIPAVNRVIPERTTTARTGEAA